MASATLSLIGLALAIPACLATSEAEEVQKLRQSALVEAERLVPSLDPDHRLSAYNELGAIAHKLSPQMSAGLYRKGWEIGKADPDSYWVTELFASYATNDLPGAIALVQEVEDQKTRDELLGVCERYHNTNNLEAAYKLAVSGKGRADDYFLSETLFNGYKDLSYEELVKAFAPAPRELREGVFARIAAETVDQDHVKSLKLLGQVSKSPKTEYYFADVALGIGRADVRLAVSLIDGLESPRVKADALATMAQRLELEDQATSRALANKAAALVRGQRLPPSEILSEFFASIHALAELKCESLPPLLEWFAKEVRNPAEKWPGISQTGGSYDNRDGKKLEIAALLSYYDLEAAQMLAAEAQKSNPNIILGSSCFGAVWSWAHVTIISNEAIADPEIAAEKLIRDLAHVERSESLRDDIATEVAERLAPLHSGQAVAFARALGDSKLEETISMSYLLNRLPEEPELIETMKPLFSKDPHVYVFKKSRVQIVSEAAVGLAKKDLARAFRVIEAVPSPHERALCYVWLASKSSSPKTQLAALNAVYTLSKGDYSVRPRYEWLRLIAAGELGPDEY